MTISCFFEDLVLVTPVSRFWFWQYLFFEILVLAIFVSKSWVCCYQFREFVSLNSGFKESVLTFFSRFGFGNTCGKELILATYIYIFKDLILATNVFFQFVNIIVTVPWHRI